ncbi:hypothetical protein AGMMS49545_19320 [Betaproteobacteria bacterium]|nr:hypothetical protein AGMMS49545_19320 [Betaproteobacteria bacterium]GHU47853.1 hypothetical protein AGMMS50289_23640 [Betaproteobacteria bacterium]
MSRKIHDFGEIYDYLKDGKLRAKEAGSQVIVVKNADFSGERFGGTEWQYFDFVDCSFESNYTIMLKWLTDSTFTNCRFRGIFGLGQTTNVRFVHCKVEGESHIGFDWKSRNLVFENCEFTNSNSDPNHIGSVGSAGEIMFISCKTRNIAWGGEQEINAQKLYG